MRCLYSSSERISMVGLTDRDIQLIQRALCLDHTEGADGEDENNELHGEFDGLRESLGIISL